MLSLPVIPAGSDALVWQVLQPSAPPQLVPPADSPAGPPDPPPPAHATPVRKQTPPAEQLHYNLVAAGNTARA